jgi:hypothetical protein
MVAYKLERQGGLPAKTYWAKTLAAVSVSTDQRISANEPRPRGCVPELGKNLISSVYPDIALNIE